MICPSCEGSGELEYTCSSCNGSGEGMADGSTCWFCKGQGTTGVQDCEECEGKGRVLCCDCGEDKEDMTFVLKSAYKSMITNQWHQYGDCQCEACKALEEVDHGKAT